MLEIEDVRSRIQIHLNIIKGPQNIRKEDALHQVIINSKKLILTKRSFILIVVSTPMWAITDIKRRIWTSTILQHEYHNTSLILRLNYMKIKIGWTMFTYIRTIIVMWVLSAANPKRICISKRLIKTINMILTKLGDEKEGKFRPW